MRLFAALNFEGEFLEAILARQTELRRLTRQKTPENGGGGRRINWSREENLHLTLAFIGERESPADAIRALGEIRVPPVDLSLGKPFLLGTVLCLGLESEGGLKPLASAVRDALGKAGVPFDPKPFRPHITLAREFRRPLPALPPEFWGPVSARIGEFALMLSDRGGENGRLRYTPLAVFPLTGPSYKN